MRPRPRVLLVCGDRERLELLRYVLYLRGYAVTTARAPAAMAAEARRLLAEGDGQPERGLRAVVVLEVGQGASSEHLIHLLTRVLYAEGPPGPPVPVLLARYRAETELAAPSRATVTLTWPDTAELLERLRVLCQRKRGPLPRAVHVSERKVAA